MKKAQLLILSLRCKFPRWKQCLLHIPEHGVLLSDQDPVTTITTTIIIITVSQVFSLPISHPPQLASSLHLA